MWCGQCSPESTTTTIADQVAMLHGGKVRWTGPAAEMEHCGDPYVEQFVSGSADGPIEAVR